MGCKFRLEDLRVLGFRSNDHFMRSDKYVVRYIVIVVQIWHNLLAVQAGVLFTLALVQQYLTYVQKYFV